MDVTSYVYSVGSTVYATLSILIAIQARQKANALLSACCAITAIWAATSVYLGPQLLDGIPGYLDLARLLMWYVYLLGLYRQAQVASSSQIFGFGLIACAGLGSSIFMLVTLWGVTTPYSIYSLPIATRLILSICELLLIENLYLNLPDSARWHVALPCILLAGLACFDILVVADAALFRRPSIPLENGRVIAMITVAPLLVLAAFRGQRWREQVRLSRAAVFHSATLVLSGSLLLSLVLAGEVLRRLDATWGWIAELTLVFSGLICVMLFTSSRSARSLMDRMVVHHFFADRYDYRSEWLSCIATLSGKGDSEQNTLHMRAIKAVADVVNSPNGSIFIQNDLNNSLDWAYSWNMPATADFSPSHPIARSLADDGRVLELLTLEQNVLESEPLVRLGPVWLAIPLRHPMNFIGIIVVGPPRVAFRLDQEVFDLLGILGQEVGTHIAEQRAMEAVYRTRRLHDYGKRFAFVAHDIKNVASQLSLLLSNAEQHLANPDFQQDMLGTVRASVEKIDRLLKRLDGPSASSGLQPMYLRSRVEGLVKAFQRAGRVNLSIASDGSEPQVMIDFEAFDAAVSHLINNAIEAAPGRPVVVRIDSDSDRAIIKIVDEGGGMSSEFIRDELFSPLKTRRSGGSGIGAFQARELINENGGELTVISQQGIGTTMRIQLSRIDGNKSLISADAVTGVAGG